MQQQYLFTATWRTADLAELNAALKLESCTLLRGLKAMHLCSYVQASICQIAVLTAFITTQLGLIACLPVSDMCERFS